MATDMQREKAEYIHRMTIELSRLATRESMTVLCYLLEMAAQEASVVMNSRPDPIPAGPSGFRRPRQRPDSPGSSSL